MGKSIRKSMSSESVYMIIDQAHSLGYSGKVCLHRLSEPFVDLRYIEFAQYIKNKGMHLREDTNGDYLKNNPDLCAQLDGLLASLCIGLYDYKNDEEKRQQMEFWRNRFKKTDISFSLPREMCGVRINSLLDGNRRVPKKSFHSWLPCYMPAEKFLIRYDGRISLCCEDDLCSIDLGNAFEQKLEELWWSPRRVAITADLLKFGGRRKFALCRSCYLGQIVDYDKLFGSVSN
jgi:MoaA/NifB/PqqE/SkfB family radical SAM enzyme